MSKYEHKVSYYSKFKEGDKITFEYDGKRITGVVDSVYPDIVDSQIIPVYVVENCDVRFGWGDNGHDCVYESMIITED